MPRGMNQFSGPHDRMPGGGKISKSVWRLFGFVFKNYKISIPFVVICIIVTSLTTLTSNLFTKTLIDDYITPMVEQGSSDYAPLSAAMLRLGAILIIGIIASYVYNILMVHVGHGTLNKLRGELFRHMEKLPLSYFDNHSHGEIMSVYTNDVDTLRQVITQSVTGILRSLVTIIATLVSMIVMSPVLSVVSVLLALFMFWVTRRLGMISKKYFTERQKNLGIINGFIEEMVSGQRVVKVYNHENVSPAVVEAEGWEVLRDTDYAGRVYLYDSERDSFMMAFKALGYSMNTDDPAEIEAAYEWLSNLLCTPPSEAHIGYLGEYYCKEVIAESKKLLEQGRKKQQQRRPVLCEGGAAS